MQALYRFYDADDELLYVGISKNPGSRFRGSSYFWASVATIKLEWFNTRDEVAKAERQAIKSEHPRYNKAHNNYSRRKDERLRGWVGGPPNVVELAAMIARGEDEPLGPTMERVISPDDRPSILWDDGAGYIIASIEKDPRVFTVPYGQLKFEGEE